MEIVRNQVQLSIREFDSKRYLDELDQNQAITESLINKILYSKRLLVDHVESLEQCLSGMQKSGPTAGDKTAKELFTLRNTCMFLGTTLLEHIITPKSFRYTIIPSAIVSGTFSALYMVKNIFRFRNKIVEKELESLICTIDEFGNCIRRNMTYFNEILMMKTAELIESRQCERAWDCITSAKEVTEILYDATRKLEDQYPLPVRFAAYYAPMEELRECEYFMTNVTDYSPKNLKDFHNIFAYVQSQFLLRLALTISQKPSIGKINMGLVKLTCQIKQLVSEEEEHFKNLTLDLNKKKQLEMNELHATKTMRNISGPAAVLQESSLKLSGCMVAVAAECTQLDIALQRLTISESNQNDNSQSIIEVANSMRSIENTLSVCFDDFQRLMLVYNKFLSSKLQDKKEANDDHQADPDNHITDDSVESFLRVEISNDAENCDDFYAYMFDEKEQQAASNEKDINEDNRHHDMKILNFEKRVTKRKFKPVLKQLKDRIDPIRQEMYEKERKVLAAKGINIEELFKKSDSNGENNLQQSLISSDSEGSADEIDRYAQKSSKDCDNFAEMRNFLAQKQAINLYQLDDIPKSTSLEEDLLE